MTQSSRDDDRAIREREYERDDARDLEKMNRHADAINGTGF
jgi:hypothetical protein